MSTGITLLVVDDDPEVRSSTARLMKQSGYSVIEASTGDQGIRLARNSKPDLILLDVMLPDMNGIDVCRVLKNDPGTAASYIVIISSMKIAPSDQAQGLEIGADDYITRPIQNRELIARINASARLKQAEKKLSEREQLLTAVVNGIQAHLFLLDRTMSLFWMNQKTSQSMNFPGREYRGLKCHALRAGHDDPCKGCPVLKTLELQEPAESIIEFPGGVIRHCFSEPLISDTGDIHRILVVETDITRQKHLENELLTHQNHLEEQVQARTVELQKQINTRKQAEKVLRRQKKNIAINNRIASAFLSSMPDELYKNVLEAVLDIFNSTSGYFGHVDDTGDLICEALVRQTLPAHKTGAEPFVFHRQDWDGFWGNSLVNKVSLLSNHELLFIDGSTLVNNGLTAPLLVNDRLIGQLAVAGSPRGYSPNDRLQLELLCEFISPFLFMFMEREQSKTDLQIHARKLEEKNIALNVLLENRNENNRKMAETILKNFERLVFPYHEKLRFSQRRDEMTTLLKIIEENTLESLEPLEKSVPVKYKNFTPMEIQVADLIKAGKTSKDIAAIMAISERSVFFHRNNIRRKLEIRNTSKNLRSILLAL